MPQITPSEVQTFASIKVVGVGGAGGSAINRMKDAGLAGVQFIAMNTDAQALHNSKADVKIHLGHTTTNGLGAGADQVLVVELDRALGISWRKLLARWTSWWLVWQHGHLALRVRSVE